jgi:hypothetical protein
MLNDKLKWAMTRANAQINAHVECGKAQWQRRRRV